MWNTIRWFGMLLGVLAAGRRAAAQESVAIDRQRWFPETQLAPLSDWRRPDLAARRVQTVTREFAGSRHWMLLGDSHGAEAVGYPCREVLTYDPAGYLVRYKFALLTPGRVAAQWLQNDFSYDARHRLRRIQFTGTPALLTVTDDFTSKAYLHWRQLNDWVARPASLPFRLAHGIPPERLPVAPTLQVREVQCRYNARGQPLLPQATVELRSKTIAWRDTLPLDPQRGWRLAALDSLAGRADTAWQHSPTAWLRPTVQPVAGALAGLRVQLRPPLANNYISAHVDDGCGLTSLFRADGQLGFARDACTCNVFEYAYDAQGQPIRFDNWLMHAPDGPATPAVYFGHARTFSPILDCEGRQRRSVALPDGELLIAERQSRQLLRYEPGPTGLPTRAVVQVSYPRYVPRVNFSRDNYYAETRQGVRRLRKGWRKTRARNQRAAAYRARGCVPMTMHEEPPHSITLAYTFFP